MSIYGMCWNEQEHRDITNDVISATVYLYNYAFLLDPNL